MYAYYHDNLKNQIGGEGDYNNNSNEEKENHALPLFCKNCIIHSPISFVQIDHNAPCLPLLFCITNVFDFRFYSNAKFWGVKNMHYCRCENGKWMIS